MHWVHSTLGYVLFVALLSLLLLGLHAVPHCIDAGAVRPYQKLEDVRRLFPAATLRLPTYYPERIAWPPQEILAGKRPSVLLLHFADKNDGTLVLAIRESQLSSAQLPLRLEPVQTLQTSYFEVDGAPASLEIALCADRRPCNRVHWQADGYDYTAVGRMSGAELTRLAESMRPGGRMH